MAAANIGTGYNWAKRGWKVKKAGSIKKSDLQAGVIFNVKANNAFRGTSWAGHTGVIKDVTSKKIITYEQNISGRQVVLQLSFTNFSAFIGSLTSICIPPELVRGATVKGTTTSTKNTNGETYISYEKKQVKETKTEPLYINKKTKQKWKNDKGEVEFELKESVLYANISRDMYPAVLTGKEVGNDWIYRKVDIDTKDEKKLISEALKLLKANAYPKIKYTVDGYLPVGIGDTIRIDDDSFNPKLLLQARVTEQHISHSDSSKRKTILANFKELDNLVSDTLLARMDAMFKDAQPYSIKVSSDNGTTFVNNTGTTTIVPSLVKMGSVVDDPDVSWRYSLDGSIFVGDRITINGSDIDKSAVLTISGYIGNEEVDTTEITLTNVIDGATGQSGSKGADGRTSYTHFAWSNSADGSKDFSVDTSSGRSYMGVYSDFEEQDSLDSTMYKWTLIQGPRGPQGAQGLQGDKGADGRTQYIHVAYANTATGEGFSQSDTNKPYIGVYTDFEQSDSKNPAQYRWTKIKGNDGAQGLPGAKGEDGRTPYVHFAYADSSDGKSNFSTTSSTNKRYLGTYTDFEQSDSNDPTKYNWTALFDNVSVGGVNYIKNGRFSNYDEDGIINDWVVVGGDDVVRDVFSYVDKFNKQGLHFYNKDANKASSVRLQGYEQVIDLGGRSGDEFTIGVTWARNDGVTMGRPNIGLHFLSDDDKVLSQAWMDAKTFGNPTNLTRVSETLRAGSDFSKIRFMLYGESNVYNDFFIECVQLESGNVATSYKESQEDIIETLDSKADEALTQEQIAALQEAAQVANEELKAKASLEALSRLEEAYQAFVAKNEADRIKSEEDLITAATRVEKISMDLGQLKETKNFIDTYMSSSEEGLIIGKNDSTSTIKVTTDRISMFSAGKEVMYISQGVINIDNGIFTKTLKVGRFVTEQYDQDPDINVIRYIGG